MMKKVLLGTCACCLLFAWSGCSDPSSGKKGNNPDGKAEKVTAEETVDQHSAKLDSLTKLLDEQPGNTDLLNERATAFLDVGELNYALADIGRALLLDSTRSDYYLTIADVYFQRNEPKRCLNALNRAHELAPMDVEPLYRLAQFQLYLGKHQKCIDKANQMLEIETRDDRPFMIKGLCYKDMGDTNRSIQNYQMAVTQNPDNYDAFVELGVLHYGLQDPLAEQYLKSALDIRPEGLDALYALGMSHQQQEEYNDALETYSRILRVDSTYTDAYYNTGFIQYQHLQSYDEALQNFDRCVKLDPKYHQAVYMRGLCYESKGDEASAKREYSYALELKPEYALAAQGMERLLSKKK